MNSACEKFVSNLCMVAHPAVPYLRQDNAMVCHVMLTASSRAGHDGPLAPRTVMGAPVIARNMLMCPQRARDTAQKSTIRPVWNTSPAIMSLAKSPIQIKLCLATGAWMLFSSLMAVAAWEKRVSKQKRKQPIIFSTASIRVVTLKAKARQMWRSSSTVVHQLGEEYVDVISNVDLAKLTRLRISPET